MRGLWSAVSDVDYWGPDPVEMLYMREREERREAEKAAEWESVFETERIDEELCAT